jgi:hypothetical protein
MVIPTASVLIFRWNICTGFQLCSPERGDIPGGLNQSRPMQPGKFLQPLKRGNRLAPAAPVDGYFVRGFVGHEADLQVQGSPIKGRESMPGRGRLKVMVNLIGPKVTAADNLQASRVKSW